MVGASELDEIPFGFTADGLYQIILKPSKFFSLNFFCTLSIFK